MKKILVAASLLGMLMPALASAELDYNIANIGFASKISRGTRANFSEFNFGASKSVSDNLYLGASFQTGTQPTVVDKSNKRVHSISLGAGFHMPLQKDIDAIVAGHVFQGTDLTAGSTAKSNGYDIGTGVRAGFDNGLEGGIMAVYSSISNAANPDNDTYINVQFGFDFTPNIQMYGGIDLFRSDQTMNFGIRVFY